MFLLRHRLKYERERSCPPSLQGSLKPLKKIKFLPNLLKTLLISCSKQPWMSSMFKALIHIRLLLLLGFNYAGLLCNIITITTIRACYRKWCTHMATKLSSNPIRSWLNTKEPFAESSRIIVVPLRSWKYAVLIALPSLCITISWHYHLLALSSLTCPQINSKTTYFFNTQGRNFSKFLLLLFNLKNKNLDKRRGSSYPLLPKKSPPSKMVNCWPHQGHQLHSVLMGHAKMISENFMRSSFYVKG